MINGLDLFSGIGGLALALAPWVRPVAYCEKDKFAQAVLLSRISDQSLPGAPIWDDVRTLRGDALPRIEFICAGWPCQDISLAGIGKGLEGERSGLFFEILRLVDETRPKFIFLENVPAIVVRGGLRIAAEIAARGYDMRWKMFSASEFGAPHIRERWFLLAYANGEQRRPKRCKPASSGGLFKDKSCGRGEEVRNAERLGCNGRPVEKPEQEKARIGRFALANRWPVEPALDRVVDGVSVPARVDRIKALGNAVVPLQAREAFKMLMGLECSFPEKRNSSDLKE